MRRKVILLKGIRMKFVTRTRMIALWLVVFLGFPGAGSSDVTILTQDDDTEVVPETLPNRMPIVRRASVPIKGKLSYAVR
jgi:hypothetical protein